MDDAVAVADQERLPEILEPIYESEEQRAQILAIVDRAWADLTEQSSIAIGQAVGKR